LRQSKGKSKRARHLRKQQALLTLCRSAPGTSMSQYLKSLLALLENLYAEKRLLLILDCPLKSVNHWLTLEFPIRIATIFKIFDLFLHQ
jgi:hypothetical protein